MKVIAVIFFYFCFVNGISFTWSNDSLPLARGFYYNGLTMGNAIYYGNGYDSKGITSRIEIYDGTWSVHQASSNRTSQSASVYVNGYGFFAGMDTKGVPTVDIYNSVTTEWSKEYVPNNLILATSVGKSAVFADLDDSIAFYSPEKKSWDTRFRPSEFLWKTGAMASAGNRYVVLAGGFTDSEGEGSLKIRYF